jgi:hypothetical protein
LGDHIKEKGIVRTCSTYGGDEKYYLGDLGIDGRIIRNIV